MKRRAFTQKAGTLATAAFIPKSLPTNPTPPKYKLGYQLFSIRDEMAKKPLETLKTLKVLGYQDFEMYGFDENEGIIYGYKPKGT